MFSNKKSVVIRMKEQDKNSLKEIDVPIISKITREKDSMLDYEIETTKIYDIITNDNLVKKEFNRIIYRGDKSND